MKETYNQSVANAQVKREIIKKFNNARLALSMLRTEEEPATVRKNYNIAFDNYNQLLQQGYTSVYYGLFSIFYNGKAVKDNPKAWDYLQKGVQVGDNACIGELATMYLIGNKEFNIVKDIEMAKQILSRQQYKDTTFLAPLGWLTQNDDDYKEAFREGLIKTYLCKLAIYKKYGGFGEDGKTQKLQIKTCKKMIKYYSKYDYFAEKWAISFKKEYLR